MKIHEYQAKEVLRQFGVVTPRGIPCFTVDEAVAAGATLGGAVWVVKAQIHAGGRGKGGGVKVVKSGAELREWSARILGMQLKTHQTGPDGQVVRRLLIEEGADIRMELYIGMVVDRVSQRVVLMVDVPVAGLRAGDVGTVALVHQGGRGYEVEFVGLAGDTLAVLTLDAAQVRAPRPCEITRVREPAGVAAE